MKNESKYWIIRKDQEMGPYNYDILLKLWKKNELKITDKIKADGSNVIKDLSLLVPSLEKAASSNPDEGRKSWAIAGLVLLILGLSSIALPLITFPYTTSMRSIIFGIGFLVVGIGLILGARSRK